MIELKNYENGVSSFCQINEQSYDFWKKKRPTFLWVNLSKNKKIPKRKIINKK